MHHQHMPSAAAISILFSTSRRRVITKKSEIDPLIFFWVSESFLALAMARWVVGSEKYLAVPPR